MGPWAKDWKNSSEQTSPQPLVSIRPGSTGLDLRGMVLLVPWRARTLVSRLGLLSCRGLACDGGFDGFSWCGCQLLPRPCPLVYEFWVFLCVRVFWLMDGEFCQSIGVMIYQLIRLFIFILFLVSCSIQPYGSPPTLDRWAVPWCSSRSRSARSEFILFFSFPGVISFFFFWRLVSV